MFYIYRLNVRNPTRAMCSDHGTSHQTRTGIRHRTDCRNHQGRLPPASVQANIPSTSSFMTCGVTRRWSSRWWRRSTENSSAILRFPKSKPIGSMGRFGLGPLAVVPGEQGKGAWSAFVRAGLDRLKQRGANGCVLLGEPGYYHRFGFNNDPDLFLAEGSREHFMALCFSNLRARGVVRYHQAFFRSC